MLMKKIMALSHPGHPARGRHRRRRQRHARTRSPSPPSGSATTPSTSTRRCAWRQYWDDPKQLQLGPLPKFANGEGSTVFWTTGSCAVQVRQEQGEGGRVHQGADLRPADLEGLRSPARETAHPGQLPPYKSIYAEWDAEQARLDAASSSAWSAASSTRPRRSPTTSSACSSSSSASRSGRPTSRARRPDPKRRHAEGGRRGAGRDEARLSREADAADRGGRSRCSRCRLLPHAHARRSHSGSGNHASMDETSRGTRRTPGIPVGRRRSTRSSRSTPGCSCCRRSSSSSAIRSTRSSAWSGSASPTTSSCPTSRPTGSASTTTSRR